MASASTLASIRRAGQQADFDDANWIAVKTRDEATVPICWHAGNPVRRIAEFAVKEWWQPRPGAWIADIGRNIAGRARLKLSAPAGTIIRLRFAEVLQSDRSLYVDNLRSAVSIDEYVCSGDRCRNLGASIYLPWLPLHRNHRPPKPDRDAG